MNAAGLAALAVSALLGLAELDGARGIACWATNSRWCTELLEPRQVLRPVTVRGFGVSLPPA